MSSTPAHLSEFAVHQKVRPIGNLYRVLTQDGDERLLAFAKQKKMKLKEEIKFFADEDQGELLFRLKSRQVMDVHATTDVLDPDGNVLGSFTKKFARSLAKTTWELEYDGVMAIGTETSTGKAVARRMGLPLRYDVSFVDRATNDEVLRIHREFSMADKYTVAVPDQRLSLAVAAGIVVAQDALSDR